MLSSWRDLVWLKQAPTMVPFIIFLFPPVPPFPPPLACTSFSDGCCCWFLPATEGTKRYGQYFAIRDQHARQSRLAAMERE